MPRDHTPVFFTIIDYEEHKCHLVRIGNLLVSLIITLFIEFGIILVASNVEMCLLLVCNVPLISVLYH